MKIFEKMDPFGIKKRRKKKRSKEQSSELARIQKSIVEAANAEKRRAMREILQNDATGYCSEAELEQRWIRGCYPNPQCTFDELRSTSSERLQKASKRITIERSGIAVNHLSVAEKIRGLFLDCLGHANSLYGDLPIGHHIGIEISNGNAGDHQIGAGVISYRKRDVQKSLWQVFDAENQQTRSTSHRKLVLTNPQYFLNPSQIVEYIDHETGHIAGGTMQPDSLCLREALAEAHRLNVTELRLNEVTEKVSDDVKEQVLFASPVQVLASEQSGGWGIPEGAQLDHHPATTTVLYRGFLCDLIEAMEGDVNTARYIFQAMISHWQIKNKLWKDTNRDYTSYVPMLDQWLDEMDRVLEHRGIKGFADRYRSKVNDELPSGKRIVWVPQYNGGELCCMNCLRSSKDSDKQSATVQQPSNVAVADTADPRDDYFASLADAAVSINAADGFFASLGDGSDTIMPAEPPNSGTGVGQEGPWAKLEPAKMTVELCSIDRDGNRITLDRQENVDRYIVSGLYMLHKLQSVDLRRPHKLCLVADSNELKSEKNLQWIPESKRIIEE